MMNKKWRLKLKKSKGLFKRVFYQCGLLLLAAASAQAQSSNVTEAREAMRKKDRTRLAALRVAAVDENQPLALWVDYWELSGRISTAGQDEIDAFYKRWPGTYVEDRLRNDWLLELGKRRDWKVLTLDHPRFRMNDDREVTCYALLADHLSGKDVRVAGRAAWLAQKEADDGCSSLAANLFEAKHITATDVWRRARLNMEANRPRAARQAVLLLGPAAVNELDELNDSPTRYLLRRKSTPDRATQELATLALIKLAANDADASANFLSSQWETQLRPDQAAWAWAATAKQAALKLQTNAPGYFEQAAVLSTKGGGKIDWSDDTLAWATRAALRGDNGAPRWPQVLQAISAMSATEQRDPTWVYWKARGLRATTKASTDSATLDPSQELFKSIAGQYHFYGTLAAEELGKTFQLPPAPAPLTAAERSTANQNAGLQRALQLYAEGLRNEGNREWNYSLRDLDDRALLAAAQLGCERELWDRCINTSDRTKTERFPTPHRADMLNHANAIGLDPAYVYGLIRQESRFITDARSGVGASGLMQIMPATARWTAKKIGMAFTQSMINERDTNIKLGTNYLKFVLDDLDGSQAMAAAAYNAGPNRPRKWRDGPAIEPAIWAENIPFGETRDYVKKVLSNAIFYSALLAAQTTQALPTLKARLGKHIASREPNLAPPDPQLP
jgi:soluble lytic murein transglycosylase